MIFIFLICFFIMIGFIQPNSLGNKEKVLAQRSFFFSIVVSRNVFRFCVFWLTLRSDNELPAFLEI